MRVEDASILPRAAIINRERVVDSMGGKMQITVTLGCIFLKEPGHDKVQVT